MNALKADESYLSSLPVSLGGRYSALSMMDPPSSPEGVGTDVVIGGGRTCQRLWVWL